jgi:hypothetical protein
MPSWFVPPTFVPTGPAVLIAACTIYLARVLPSTGVPSFVTRIDAPRAAELA